MITRIETLKRIKVKVEDRKSAKIRLKRQVPCEFKEGVFSITTRRKAVELFKQGSSVMFVDENHEVRNIRVLDTPALHTILFMLLTNEERSEIALNDFFNRYPHLVV
jgi:hypothetical protein